MVAVHLGEIRQHAAAEGDAGKGLARRVIGFLETRHAERVQFFQGEIHQPRLGHQDGAGLHAGGGDGGRGVGHFLFQRVLAGRDATISSTSNASASC